MGNWATVHSKRRQETKKTSMLKKWPKVNYVEIVLTSKTSALINFGLLEDTWIPLSMMFELNRADRHVRVNRKMLEDKGVEVEPLITLSPQRLEARKKALLFLEWKHRND